MPTVDISSSLPAGPKPLLVTARQAAAALAISERTLWTLTSRGEVPAVRFGRAVRYDVRDLERLVIDKKKNAQGNGRPTR